MQSVKVIAVGEPFRHEKPAGRHLPAGAHRPGSAALVDLGLATSSCAMLQMFCYLPTCILMRVPSLMSWA